MDTEQMTPALARQEQRAASAPPVAPRVERQPGDPRVGYYFAVLNAIISGVAIYVNSTGVKMFADSTLYTALKNSVVGVALLLPLLFMARNRVVAHHRGDGPGRQLTRQQRALLLLVALIGGSVAYALDFRGLQISTSVTAAVIDHSQFLFVALLAAVLLRERFGPAIWLALLVLFIGLTIGLKLNVVHWDTGVIFLLAGTILFALDAIVIKYLLRSVSMLTVMVFKMSLGAVLLLAYVAVSGHLGAIRHLTSVQWSFVLATGLILLAFTVTAIAGLRYASATAVTAIPAGAPLITTLLVVVSQHVALAPLTVVGLALVLVAVFVVYTVGRRQELRAWQARQRQQEKMVIA